jgi:spore coat protein U-like protein
VGLLAAVATAAILAGGPILAQGSATANLNVSANVKANCTIVTDPVAFGAYDATTGNPVDQQGAIRLTCTKGTPASITLNDGATPQGAAQRAMAGGAPAGFLRYELFFDAGRTQRWGTSGAQIFTPPSAPDNLEHSFPVYGRILTGQTTVSQGNYADTVLATVNF